MTSWHEACGLDEPVRGSEMSFDAAANAWAATHRDANSLEDEFNRIIYDTSSIACQGLSIERLKAIMGKYQSPIGQLIVVSHRTEAIMRHHASRLRELKAEADRALARASVQSSRRRSAIASADALESRRRSLRNQLDQVPQISVDPHTQSERTRLTGEVQRSSLELQDARALVARCDASLASERATWRSLRAQEEQLNDATRRSLHTLDLGVLGDPSNLEKLRNAVVDYAKCVVDYIGDHWQEWLSKLYEVLDSLLDALSIFSGFMNVLAKVVGFLAVFFPVLAPFAAAFAIMGAVLAVVALALSALKFVVGAVLWGNGATNPTTGRPFSAGDLFKDGVEVGFGVLGVKGAGDGMRQLAKADPIRANRSLLRSGIIDDRFTRTDLATKIWTGRGLTIGGRALVEPGKGAAEDMLREFTHDRIDETIDSPTKTLKTMKNFATVGSFGASCPRFMAVPAGLGG